MEDLRYPIGRFEPAAEALTEELRRRCISEIEATPIRLRDAVRGLDAGQLDTPYRPDGWTVRQVVHHIPDSHLNAYVRFKLGATEDEPTIKTYEEKDWAELPDAKTGDVEVSLRLLEALHRRWVAFLGDLPAGDYERAIRHPELGRVTLGDYLQLYAWHGRHHVAHITSLREREGW